MEKQKIVKLQYCNQRRIGQSKRGKLNANPPAGVKVWMGIGSVIAGNTTIVSNVSIAPNSFVNADVTANSMVLGNPCKIISKENPCEGHINHALI